MTAEQRASIDNAIYMCQQHAKLIDTDESKYTVALLKQWKADAERRAQERIGVPEASPGDSLTIYSAMAVYTKTYKAIGLVVDISNPSDNPNTIRHVFLKIDGTTYEAQDARSGLNLAGYEWLPPKGLRIDPWGSVCGAWFFGWSFGGSGKRIDVPPHAEVELRVEATRGGLDCGRVELIHPDAPARQPVPTAPVGVPTSIVRPLGDVLQHERATFAKLDELLPEQWLLELMDSLQTDDSYLSSEMLRLRGFLRECEKAGSGFIDDALNERCDALVAALRALGAFMAKRFFRYPEDQRGEDSRLAMAPHLNVDRGSPTHDQSMEYRKLQDELDAKAGAVRDAYAAYRKAVKMTLAV